MPKTYIARTYGRDKRLVKVNVYKNVPDKDRAKLIKAIKFLSEFQKHRVVFLSICSKETPDSDNRIEYLSHIGDADA